MSTVTKDKAFTTFEQQIQILKDRNLKFGDEETALKALQRCGYYNIINGYKDPYVEIVDGKERYKDGTTFEQIFSLYKFDREVRNRLMDSMLEFEENLRTAVAHTLAESFTEQQASYLDHKNFRLGKKRDGKYQLDEILTKFNKILKDDTQPMKHYRNTYGNIPPWILLKGASFGNLVNFIKLMKTPQKERIISLIYDMPLSLVQTTPQIKELFMDTLFVCLDYRNRSAHGGRIYNFETKSTFRYTPLLHSQMQITPADYRRGKGKTGLIALYNALGWIDNKSPAIRLEVAINYFLEEHCNIYPDDRAYLEYYIKL